MKKVDDVLLTLEGKKNEDLCRTFQTMIEDMVIFKDPSKVGLNRQLQILLHLPPKFHAESIGETTLSRPHINPKCLDFENFEKFTQITIEEISDDEITRSLPDFAQEGIKRGTDFIGGLIKRRSFNRDRAKLPCKSEQYSCHIAKTQIIDVAVLLFGNVTGDRYELEVFAEIPYRRITQRTKVKPDLSVVHLLSTKEAKEAFQQDAITALQCEVKRPDFISYLEEFLKEAALTGEFNTTSKHLKFLLQNFGQVVASRSSCYGCFLDGACGAIIVEYAPKITTEGTELTIRYKCSNTKRALASRDRFLSDRSLLINEVSLVLYSLLQHHHRISSPKKLEELAQTMKDLAQYGEADPQQIASQLDRFGLSQIAGGACSSAELLTVSDATSMGFIKNGLSQGTYPQSIDISYDDWERNHNKFRQLSRKDLEKLSNGSLKIRVKVFDKFLGASVKKDLYEDEADEDRDDELAESLRIGIEETDWLSHFRKLTQSGNAQNFGLIDYGPALVVKNRDTNQILCCGSFAVCLKPCDIPVEGVSEDNVQFSEADKRKIESLLKIHHDLTGRAFMRESLRDLRVLRDDGEITALTGYDPAEERFYSTDLDWLLLQGS